MLPVTAPSDLELDLKHLWHGNIQHESLTASPPLQIVRGDGCYVYDSAGTRYLDALAGLFCVNVGYGRREIAEAVFAQMTELAYYPLTQSHPPAAKLASRLASLLPRELNRVFFTNSGSEAVETALKIARQAARRLHPNENRYKVIARHRGYHGCTMGALSATGQAPRKKAFEPLLSGFIHVAPPDRFHCLHCASHSSCTLDCATEVERVIQMEGADTIAAVIAEPVIGSGGVLPAPQGYLTQLRTICDRYGVLLILDEVVTGFGRTGKMFGFEHESVTADLLTLAKGLTSGYLPLGATVASERIFDLFRGGAGEKLVHVSTFGGNPSSCAAALNNIDILLGEQLPKNAATVGSFLLEKIRSIRSELIGEVRGSGLLIGIELIESQKTPMQEQRIIQIIRQCRQAGLLLARNNETDPNSTVLLLSPPLILTFPEAEVIADTLDRILNDTAI